MQEGKNKTKQTVTAEAAVSRIPDGANLMIGGFMGVGTPERLIDELVLQGKRDLTVISNDTARPGSGIGKLITALRADFALVHAFLADYLGNLG